MKPKMPPTFVLLLIAMLATFAFVLAMFGPDDQLTGAAVVGFINAVIAVYLGRREGEE